MAQQLSFVGVVRPVGFISTDGHVIRGGVRSRAVQFLVLLLPRSQIFSFF